MLSYDNVPLKKEKAFVNFALNSFALRHHPHIAQQMWQTFQECIKPSAAESNGHAKEKNGKSEQELPAEEPKEDEERNEEELPKKKKKKKKDSDGKEKERKAKKTKKDKDGDDTASAQQHGGEQGIEKHPLAIVISSA